MRIPAVYILAVALVSVGIPLVAQEPGPVRPRAEELRRRVRERVAERIRDDLELTSEQMRRLRATVGSHAVQRRDLEARQRVLRRALGGQLRPGVAASPDSVGRLTDELMAVRVRYAESFRDEQAELAAFLDPIQRARVMLLRERLADRARQSRGRPRATERRMER
ncbi:MAG: hypothetical protein M3Q93_09200 [Gemmatimonadota bacterium]|nr:hypothetical protein [Gemmatimonadota bacterium]